MTVRIKIASVYVDDQDIAATTFFVDDIQEEYERLLSKVCDLCTAANRGGPREDR